MKRTLPLLLLLTLCLTGCALSADPQNTGKPTMPGEPISSQASAGTDTPDPSSFDTPDAQTTAGQDIPSEAPESTENESSSETAAPEEASPVFSIDIPEGFTESDMEGFQLFCSALDGSNINMNIQPKDPSFASVTADLLRSALTDAYKKAFDMDVELTDNYFNTTTVDGYPAYRYSSTYVLSGQTITQLIVGIDEDETYTFTFTDTSGTHVELFESCAAAIHRTDNKT